MADGSVEGLKKADPRHRVAAWGGGADGNRNRLTLPPRCHSSRKYLLSAAPTLPFERGTRCPERAASCDPKIMTR